MNVKTVFEIIVGLIKIFPKIEGWIDDLQSMWINMKISKVENEIATRSEKRNAVYMQIKKAESNEERRLLSIVVADYHYDRMRDSNSEGNSTEIG
ncbi:MAG: hypothetical protein KDH96_10275 [Candidatus Riesia sp.]|nr:hypothetical protein [Candidatus Riesia sp.]